MIGCRLFLSLRFAYGVYSMEYVYLLVITIEHSALELQSYTCMSDFRSAGTEMSFVSESLGKIATQLHNNKVPIKDK